MKRNIYKSIFIVALFFGMVACTEGFEEMNTNPNSPTAVPADLFFAKMLNDGVTRGGTYQTAIELFAMNYAQYHAVSTSAFASDRYSIIDKWSINAWNSYYQAVLRAQIEIVKYAKDHPLDVAKAELAKAWGAFIAAQTSDYYGDIPYTEAGNPEISKPKFDKQKDIYYDVFNVLKNASDKLVSTTGQNAFNKEDLIYGGSYVKWRKFINSMRLRLAIRISRVDPAKAKLEGEAALNAGVFDSNEDNASVFSESTNGGWWNHLGSMSTWNEIRMSKTFEKYLKTISTAPDPRLKYYFRPASGTGQYTGQPNGLTGAEMNQGDNALAKTSQPNLYFTDSRVIVMTYGEVCFLKAEAALRGWAGAGNIKDNYENGIRASMKYISSLKNYGTSTDGYPDVPITDAEIDAYMNGGTVPFNASATTEKKLEQIITQKYLAIYPDGREAWAEVRRTGYPALTPFVAREADGADVPQGDFIKRLWIPLAEVSMNPNADETKLNNNGGRSINVRLWWDID